MKTVKSCKNTITVCQYHFMEFTSKSSIKNNSISLSSFHHLTVVRVFLWPFELIKIVIRFKYLRQ